MLCRNSVKLSISIVVITFCKSKKYLFLKYDFGWYVELLYVKVWSDVVSSDVLSSDVKH